MERIATAIMAMRNDPAAAGLEPKYATSTPYDAAAVFGASVQLPSFDKVDPETWFTVADANFSLRKVTDPTTKYYYVLSKLDAESLRQLSAFLKEPRGENLYREIKEELCNTYEPPLEEKLDALFALTDIGDDHPKKFGKEIQRLAADASREDKLKRIFVHCLPQKIVTAITGSLFGKLDAVIAAADRAWTAAAPGSATAVSAITGPAVSVSAISGPSSRGGRHGGKQRAGRPTGAQLTTVTLRVFHKKFGNAARKCVPGCSRWNEDRPREIRVFQIEEPLDGEDAQEDTASGNV